MPLLENIADNLAQVTLGPVKQSKFLETASLHFQGEPALIQLAPNTEIDSITIPFTPSCYHGTGDEPKKGIVFNIPDGIREQLELIEDKVRDELRPTFPKIDSIWRGATKASGQYPSQLRAKIKVAECKYFDSQGPTTAPEEWIKLSAIPILRPLVFIQKTIAGVTWEVVALKVGESKRTAGLSFV